MAKGTTAALFCPGCMDGVPDNDPLCPHCTYARPEKGWPKDPYVGRLINDKYRVKSRLGAGGFAQVFVAQQVKGDIDLGEVVLKFLHQNLAVRKSIRQRFVNEARAARKLHNAHVVKIFDLDFDEEGVPFIVMEYIVGKDLQHILNRRGRLSAHRTVHIALQVCEALKECHKAGIIHRDLKPQNLLLVVGDNDFVKVLDFGVAQIPTPGGSQTKTLLGTPQFMAPEQIMQQEMDGGVDIFALGVILYNCFTGAAPIEADNQMEYLQHNLSLKPTPLHEVCPELPRALGELLRRMMAKKRSDRPATMANVEEELRAIAEFEGWLSESGGPTGLMIADTELEDLGSRPGSAQSSDGDRPVDVFGATFGSQSTLPSVGGESSPDSASHARAELVAERVDRRRWLLPLAAGALLLGGGALWLALQGGYRVVGGAGPPPPRPVELDSAAVADQGPVTGATVEPTKALAADAALRGAEAAASATKAGRSPRKDTVKRDPRPVPRTNARKTGRARPPREKATKRPAETTRTGEVKPARDPEPPAKIDKKPREIGEGLMQIENWPRQKKKEKKP